MEQLDFNVQDYQALAPNTAVAHSHDSFELCLVLNGQATFFFKDQAIPVRRGALLIIPPHCVHQTLVKEDEPCADIALRFKPSAVSAYFRRYQKTFAVFADTLTKGPRITELTEAQLNAYTQPFEDFRAACHSISEATTIDTYLKLLQLLNLLAGFANTNGLFDHAESRYDAEFTMLTDYIQAHLAAPLTLQNLCEHFYLSTATIQRICKQKVRMSPMRYVMLLRVNAAIPLLKAGLPINTVAGMVGYHSQTSFTRAFRTIKQVPPSRFAKKR